MPMFNHQFINNDQQNSSPSSSKVRVSDKNNKNFTSMSNDHLKNEIARRAMALGNACRKAEYAVSQLKGLLPPDTNVVLPSDASIPTLPPSLPNNKPPQNFNIPISYDRNDRNDRSLNSNTATSSSNTTTSGMNDDNMVASLLMSLTNASWERNTNSVENDKTNNDSSMITNSPTSSNPGIVLGSFDGYSLDDDDEIYDQKHDSSSEQDLDESMIDNDENDPDINMVDNSSQDNKSSSINDSNSESNRKRTSSNRSRTRRKPSVSRVSSPSSPYSTQFTPEEILFLDEFNKLYEKRVQLGPTRQSDIASEIRQFANNAIAFGQPAVSGLVRKTKVPKEQRAVNALKAWIESGKKRLGVV
ncbi:18244_t:CDS:2 [Dentiscutata erythropus]|uniref:18244_t:CDS:1 n=1 Tax=Dentiscutata erythropus TaxID=1348616 RepID=A0A9N8YWJ1_9GLOM|nr:18244_t:CDS:2 [Dentiscutata erythropus]